MCRSGTSAGQAEVVKDGQEYRVERPDLVIAEKFGDQEEVGDGLSDDILAVIADGLPILVLVPEPALPRWRDVTGGEIAELPCDAKAIRRWWHGVGPTHPPEK